MKQARKVVVTTHVNADPDAVASACVFYSIAKALNKDANACILIPEGISRESRGLQELCNEISANIKIVKNLSDLRKLAEEMFELCIITDTASLEQLRFVKDLIISNCSFITIVDHHRFQELIGFKDNQKVVKVVDEENFSSSSELAFLFLEKVKEHIGGDELRKLLTITLAGIVADTKRFQRIAKETFSIVSKIVKYGADYERALKSLASEKPPSSRIARVKCILRHRGFRIRIKGQDVFVAVSGVGAYESDCASVLISIGYDAAFVFTEDEKLKALRIVYRGKDEVIEQVGLDMFNNIVKKLIDEFGGSGGGHKSAGGAILRTYDLKSAVMQLIKVLNSISETGVLEFAEEKI